jgi:hypothetical protein
MWQHFIPKDLVKWIRTVVKPMFQAVAIVLIEKWGRGWLLSAFAMQSSIPSSDAFPGVGTFEKPFLPVFTPLIH